MSTPLNVLADFPLSTQQNDRLRLIEEYDLWFVSERINRKQTVPPHLIEQAIQEFRRYIALNVIGYENLGMHSSEVDEVWHSFILFTREYTNFCHCVCGKIIHHQPNTSRRPHLPQTSVDAFCAAYQEVFGPIPSIWSSNRKPGSTDRSFAKSNARMSAVDCNVDGMDSVVRAGGCDSVGDGAVILTPGDNSAGAGISLVLAGDCDSDGEEPGTGDDCSVGDNPSLTTVTAGDCDVVEGPPDVVSARIIASPMILH